MWRAVVGHQFLILLRGGRVAPAIGLLALAILLAGGTGIARFRTESRAAAEFDRLARDHITHNREIARGIEIRIASGAEKEMIPPPFGSRAPNYVFTWCHPAAVLPPGPLTGMTVGIGDLHPSAYSGPGMAPVELNSNPLLLWNGYFDLTQVITQILPIVLILLLGDLLTGEREDGVLSLSLAQPISFGRLLLFKSIPAAALAFGTTVVMIGVAAAASGQLHEPAVLARLAIWLGATLLYGGFWLTLALLASTTRLSAASGTMALAGAWLMLNVLIPASANAIAGAVYPVPPRTESMALERALPEMVAKQDANGLIREYTLRHPEYGDQAQFGDQGRRYFRAHAINEAREHLLDAEENRFQEQRSRQNRLAARLSVLSPAALFLRVTTEVAGAGDGRRRDFLLQKKAHLAEYGLYLRPRIYRLPDSIFRSSDYDLIPTFHYREEPLDQVWARAAVPTAMLLLFMSGAAGVLIYRISRCAGAQI